MRNKNQRKGKRDGYVLPAVVMFIVFSILMGMVVMELGVIEKVSASRRGAREATFYVAEGGIQHALAQLRLDEDWQPAEDGQSLGDGNFYVTREDVDNRVLLASKGVIGSNEQQVNVALKFAHVWSEGIFARDAVILGSNASIASYDSLDWFDSYGEEGHTGSLNLIELANNAELWGDGAVTADGEIINPENVEGLLNLNTRFPESLTDMPDVVIPQELADLDYSDADNMNVIDWGDDTGNVEIDDAGNLTIMGNAHVELGSGSYRFNSIQVGGSAELALGDAEIYVEDELVLNGTPRWTIKGATQLYLGEDSIMELRGDSEVVVYEVTAEDGETIQSSDPSDLMIFSASDRDPAIQLGNSPDKDGVVGTIGLIYAPHGTVDLSNNTDFYGGITANKVLVGNNSNLYYDKNLTRADLDAPGELEIVSWSKPDWATGL